MKSENLVIIKCIDFVYFVVYASCCIESIVTRTSEDLVNWCHCQLRKQCLRFLLTWCFHKGNIILLNFKARQMLQCRTFIKGFLSRQWSHGSLYSLNPWLKSCPFPRSHRTACLHGLSNFSDFLRYIPHGESTDNGPRRKEMSALIPETSARSENAHDVKPRLHDTTCCQTGCQTGLTTG